MKAFKKDDKVYAWDHERLEAKHICGADTPIIGEIIGQSFGDNYLIRSIMDDTRYHVDVSELYHVGTGPIMVLEEKLKAARQELVED